MARLYSLSRTRAQYWVWCLLLPLGVVWRLPGEVRVFFLHPSLEEERELELLEECDLLVVLDDLLPFLEELLLLLSLSSSGQSSTIAANKGATLCASSC